MRFIPSKFVSVPHKHSVIITDFYLHNQLVSVGSEDGILIKSIMNTKEITLGPSQDSFSLRVASLCFQAPDKNKILYTLKGLDNEWYTAEHSPIITYSKLRPGKYTFIAKSALDDVESIALDIEILRSEERRVGKAC